MSSLSYSSRDTSTFSQTASSTSASSTSNSASEVSTTLFPSEFGFYRFSSSSTVALTTKDPSPFASIQSNSGFRSKPDLTFYQGRNKWYRQLASAQFVGPEGKPHITLGSTRYGAAPTEKVECEGFFRVSHHFSLYLNSVRYREHFQWSECSHAELKGFGIGHSSGMKLVRMKTGEVVVVYAKVSCAVKKIGKMRFLEVELGNEFQVMAVMSLIAIF
ncbi:uncharacterized protein LY89DRAFT_669181 [Mollisia scopiformis]|uniref:Uncharacterized protein n=1 Tax=Mollisia scopiformis TaxID=149040 RepID=A0A194XAC3_MOLSC|nr:uncharacterized protein LY89DRAFT_669181 [Mollisia scopiformis]KUJ16717.1 hypothetical protein LY89DRAFT_669181 [Mollisia scopiformis]